MANPPASKAKAATGKTATAGLTTRSISKSGGPAAEAPASPVDRPAAPLKTTPTTKTAAKRFLASHKLIDSPSSSITAVSIVFLLSQICASPELSDTTACIAQSIILVLPEALSIASSFSEALAGVNKKLDDLVASTENADPPTDSADKLAALEDKLDKLSEGITKSQASAGAAESAAIETQKSMEVLHREVAWETVPVRSATRHRAHTPGPPPNPDDANPPKPVAKPPTARQEAATAKRLKSQGCYYLVEPISGLRDSMINLDARALIQKAELAWEAAWTALSKTDFVKEPGKSDRPRLDFRIAVRLARGGIRYEMGDRTQAAYLSDARVAREFEKGFGDVSCKGQGALVLLQCAPLTWSPDDPAALRSLERENRLHTGDILSATWVKKISNRSPTQTKAVVRLELRSEELADRLITDGGQLEFQPVQFKKNKEEPTRCLRCQRFGHMAKKCKGLGDICSQCGGAHRSIACNDREKKFCVNCDSDAHCSYDRTCPVFRDECERFNTRKPENKSRFYNTAQDGHVHLPAHRPIFVPQTATLGDVITTANQPARPSNLHGYFPRQSTQQRQDWAAYERDTARKPRYGSEAWESESVITAPLLARISSPRDAPPHPQVQSPAPTPASNASTLRSTSPTGSITSLSPALLQNQYTPSRPSAPSFFPLRRVAVATPTRRHSVSSVSTSSTVQ